MLEIAEYVIGKIYERYYIFCFDGWEERGFIESTLDKYKICYNSTSEGIYAVTNNNRDYLNMLYCLATKFGYKVEVELCQNPRRGKMLKRG